MKGEKEAHFCLNLCENLAIRTVFHLCLTRQMRKKMRKAFDSVSTLHVHTAVYFPLMSNRITKTYVGVTMSVIKEIVI